MTWQPGMYGGGYVKCPVCGVLRKPEELKDGKCIDQERCLRQGKEVTIRKAKK